MKLLLTLLFTYLSFTCIYVLYKLSKVPKHVWKTKEFNEIYEDYIIGD